MSYPTEETQMSDVYGTDSYTAHLDALTRNEEKNWDDYNESTSGLGDPLEPWHGWIGDNYEYNPTDLGDGYLWDVGVYSTDDNGHDNDNDRSHPSGTTSPTSLSNSHYTTASYDAQSDEDLRPSAHPLSEPTLTGAIDPRMLLPTRWVRTRHGEKTLHQPIEAKRQLEKQTTRTNKAKKTSSTRTKKAQPKMGAPKKSVKATTTAASKKSVAGAGARVKAQLTTPPTRTPATNVRTSTRSSFPLPPKSTTTSRPRKIARSHSSTSTTSTNASASSSASLDAAGARGRPATAMTCASFAALSLGEDRPESATLAEPTVPIAHVHEDDETMEVELDFVRTKDLPSADSPIPEFDVKAPALPTGHVFADEELSETQQRQRDDVEGVRTANDPDPIPEEGSGDDGDRIGTATSSNPALPSTAVAELGVGRGPAIHVHVHVHGAPAPAAPTHTGYIPYSSHSIPPPPQWNPQQQDAPSHGYPYQHPPMGPPAHPGYFQPHFGHGWYPPHAFGYPPPSHGHHYPPPTHAPSFSGYAPAPRPYIGYPSSQPQPPHLPPYAGPAPSAAPTSHHSFNASTQAQGPPPASSSSNAQTSAPQRTSGREVTVWQAVAKTVIVPEVVVPSRVPTAGEKLIWCGHISAEKKWDAQAQDWRNPRCNHLILDAQDAIQNHYLHVHELDWAGSYQKCTWGSSCKRKMKGENIPRHIVDVHVDGNDGLCEGKGCKLARAGSTRWCTSEACQHIEPLWVNRDASQNFI
ncbi:hypothetical protein FA13DRAFT_1796216 [Coprinellus micaceus]|uniref:Uncharacterized protein n=1 Tax=Coprinellus micaceus TaxID=71717 RepID=A0A4Y7SVP3_COPMI|nr:hypothetical protein FA13DRAFT_1796216 [Coprinellus micaceus]